MLRHKIYLFPIIMFSTTISCGIIAAMSTTSADDISPIDDEITITVDSACTMGQTTTYTNPSLNPGETNTIGTSRISAYCNDASGYDIYAIGYTNGEYGNTSMQSTEISHTIPTGISGEGSYWNMYLAPGTNTTTPSYIPTITNNFTSPSTIPNDFTKVATYPSTTIPQSEDPLLSGSYFTTTYTSHIPTTQPAGVYTGQVQYVMVHPEGAPAPTFMQDTTAIKARLTNIGDTMQAIDKRDGKKYWVTRLADGNIWMTQNLDHDIVAGRTYTSADTDLPEGSTWVPSDSTHPTNDKTWLRSWFNTHITLAESYDPGNLYWNGQFNVYEEATFGINTTTSGDQHYHLGNYYNWNASVAINDSSSYSTRYEDINQSICPAGWTLPLGGLRTDNSSFNHLVSQYGWTYDNEMLSDNQKIWESPLFLVLGGEWDGRSEDFGRWGPYWSQTANSNEYACEFNFEPFYERVKLDSSEDRGAGLSVRCVAR